MNILTISYKANSDLVNQAKALANSLGLTFVIRKKESLLKLQAAYGAEYILVYTSSGPYVYFGPHQEHRFHLSMAQLRILNLERGQSDYLVEAMGPGIASVLDCTLGLGADAIVMSYSMGTEGHIVGIEGSLPLWFVTTQGLAYFKHENPNITKALRRIETLYGDSTGYLKQCLPNSYDLVYLDPMFEVPVEASPQFTSLRGHLMKGSLTEETLALAKGVARKRVVVKERKEANLFKRLPPDEIVGGKYSRIAYGIYYADSVRL